MMKKYAEIKGNCGALKTGDISVLSYDEFIQVTDELYADKANHCINYFAVPQDDGFRFFCITGCDEDHLIRIYSHFSEKDEKLPSITAKHYQFHIFEREIHEKYSISFIDHPWLKPVRGQNYPFYSMDSEELHEVGVGPVHAGVIEPGHFRFICNGEKVLHLEIQLGYQHRGTEKLFSQKQDFLQKAVLSESIAGDTAVGHATAHAMMMEALGNKDIPDGLVRERMIALELERMAVHIGDTAALCTDTAYQFGQVVCEALRTIVINTTQLWCGNRFGKGLIRACGTRYPLGKAASDKIRENLRDVTERYYQVAQKIYSLPGVLNRFEGTGIVTADQAASIGAVGMAARSSGLKRDVRWSFPGRQMLKENYEPVVFSEGDVWARGMVRREEVRKSYNIIIELLDQLEQQGFPVNPAPDYSFSLQNDTLAFAVTEGWRGEICHAAITGADGMISSYKIKDPSLHNWFALALAVRDQEISDFPLCNKSFNLSYCGNDL